MTILNKRILVGNSKKLAILKRDNYTCGYCGATGVELEIENQDIKNKLKSGIISSVYLQIGIDLPIIQKSVQYLRALQPNLDIYLSLMNPAPYRLAQFRYRPWKGVYLPEEYLQFPQYALNINNSNSQVAQTMQLGVIQGD